MHLRKGLKLWSVNTETYRIEAQRLFAGGVFDYVELYVLPDSLDRLPLWKALKTPYIVHCAHSVHGFNLADRQRAELNRRIYEQAKRYADELDAAYIIFHGGCDGTIEETARQLAAFHESRALIENKPRMPLPEVSAAKECRGYSIGELRTVMETAKCGFCLDFGHAVCAANSMRKEPYSYIRELFRLSPEVVHLSDIADMRSEYDNHPNLGTGQLDIAELLRLLPEETPVTIETDKPSVKSLGRFEEECALLCRLCRNGH